MPGGGAPFSYIPPAAIQNAMMKDKKPFTYTPGGIDLFSEIRSPRMQRRISKNAADEGVVLPPQQPAQQPSASINSNNQLSPQAMAAMQPQMAVPVFPPMPQQLPVLHSPVSPPPPPQPQPPSAAVAASARANLKPAMPSFCNTNSSPHEAAIQEAINTLPSRNPAPPPASPVQQSTPIPAREPQASFAERRNTQLGSIFIPPVSAAGPGPSASAVASPPSSGQVAKTPMPWMNSQNRTPSSPTPPFVQQLQQERINPIVVSPLLGRLVQRTQCFSCFSDDAHRSGPVRRR